MIKIKVIKLKKYIVYNYMQYYKNFLLYLTGTSWGILGYKRGVNEYNYEFKNNKYNNKTYLYTDKIFNGFIGIFIYVNPCFLPITIYKELYRLEIKMRNLENEKESKYYNKIIFS